MSSVNGSGSLTYIDVTCHVAFDFGVNDIIKVFFVIMSSLEWWSGLRWLKAWLGVGLR